MPLGSKESWIKSNSAKDKRKKALMNKVAAKECGDALKNVAESASVPRYKANVVESVAAAAEPGTSSATTRAPAEAPTVADRKPAANDTASNPDSPRNRIKQVKCHRTTTRGQTVIPQTEQAKQSIFTPVRLVFNKALFDAQQRLITARKKPGAKPNLEVRALKALVKALDAKVEEIWLATADQIDKYMREELPRYGQIDPRAEPFAKD